MRLLMASYCAAINPDDWVPAKPRASSSCAGDKPRSLPDAVAAEWVPKTGPECQPRSSIWVPCSVYPTRGPTSKPAIAASRSSAPLNGPVVSGRVAAVDSSAGISSEQLCSGASGWKSSSSKPWMNEPVGTGGGVAPGGRRCTGGAPGADDDGIAPALHAEHGVRGDS